MSRLVRGKPSPGSILKHVLAVVLFLIAAGCSGGGCSSGCSSCGGFTPLVNGFDPNNRIENAGSARVTPAGLQFLQTNLGTLAQGLLGGMSMGGEIDFAVPKTTQSLGPINATICPNGTNASSNPQICNANINIGGANLQISTAAPSDIHITGTIPIRAQDIPVQVGLTVCNPTINVSLDGDGSCPGGNYANIPVDVDIAIQVDQNMAHTARYGYAQVKINKIVDQAAIQGALSNDIHICGIPNCSGFCCVTNACSCALAAIADWSPVKNQIINQLVGQINNTLTSSIESALCQKATPQVPCPTGTTADSSMVCRYADNTCATTLLGTDGHMDLGGLLAKLSPGTTGGLDVLFAAGGQDPNTTNPAIAWGDLNPVAGGATLGLFGGAEANPISKCVPLSNMPVPTGIPIPDELMGAADTVPNWPTDLPGPHVEIALSERFTNYALNSAYNSGLLCLGISTESIALLSSGSIGLLAPSAKTLGLQEEPQQVAIVVRPSTPPTITFGNGTDIATDPLLRVDMKQVSLDFYIFSLDRFIRFMTATFDLDVPVNLTSSKDGLTPVIDKIGVMNGTVTNSQLLSEMPSALASALGDLIGSLVGQQLSGSLKAINLNSSLASLGIQIRIPDTVMGMGSPGLVKLTKGTDNYLGIFASFELPGMGPTPPPPPEHTSARVTRKTVDPEGLRLMTLRRDNVPVVELVADSLLDDGTHPVEYQYKVDDGFWHPFQASRFITVRDDWLRVQGRHHIYVRSRVAGQGDTIDEIPGKADVVIDAEAPKVTLHEVEGGFVRIEARDVVAADPMVRYRVDGGAWSAWTPASKLALVPVADAHDLAVEASDGEGNVGTAQQALVRGRFDGATGSSCGCKTVGGDGSPKGGALFLLGIALAGIGARFSRRRRSIDAPPKAEEAVPVTAAAPKRSLASRTLGIAATMVVASTWAGCSCNSNAHHAMTSGSGSSSSSGGDTCPNCTELQPGLIGEYTSAAVSGSDIWVAGYNEADWDNSNTYGDLVVGKWDGTKVAWQQVDGVPSTPAVDCTQYDCKGFRGGQTAAGDDVGLWTTIAIGSDMNPAVAYYDRTNHALKFAQYDGKSWTVQTVDSAMQGDTGRYAKMLFLGGNWVIAYQQIIPGGMNGALISKVRVARSAGLTPASGSWTFEDAVTVNSTPCRAQYCASTEACVSSTKQCTATVDPSMCNPACGSGQACVGAMTPSCVAIWDQSKLDAYPDAIGDYITIAPDNNGGFGLAFYDRTNGNLEIAAKSGGMWTTTIVDGESAPTPSGDAGIGASLFIDTNGDWHLTYVNGYTEALQYVKVTGGTMVGTPEIVDDGLGVGGTPNADGQHLVGDDSHVIVVDGGEVHVTYQDATAGALHYAVGAPGTMGHTWTTKAVTQMGFAGAFSNIVVANGQTQLVNWWRVGGASVNGDVRLVSPP